jgi:hypothetical protein
MGLLNISFPWQIQAQEETGIISWRECSKKSVQSCPEPLEGKAAAILTRGAYMEYVSTAKWRPACAKPLRPLARQSWLQRRARRQGTPLAAFFNIPQMVILPCFKDIPSQKRARETKIVMGKIAKNESA